MSKVKRFTKTDLQLIRMLDRALNFVPDRYASSLLHVDIRRGPARTDHGTSPGHPCNFVPGFVMTGSTGRHKIEASYAPLKGNDYQQARLIDLGDLRIAFSGTTGEFWFDVHTTGNFVSLTRRRWSN